MNFRENTKGLLSSFRCSRLKKALAYLEDGSLEIDNNLAENAIHAIALGRKNYLFAGSNRGAERAAMIYSFFATCKKNDVNPYHGSGGSWRLSLPSRSTG